MTMRTKSTAAPAKNPVFLVPSHEQFKETEASRKPFDPSLGVSVTQTLLQTGSTGTAPATDHIWRHHTSRLTQTKRAGL